MCRTDTSAEKLRRLSLESDDDYLKVELTGLNIEDIKAKDFLYHDTCYKNATRPIREQKPADPETTSRTLCFENILRFVQEEIIEKGHIYRVKEISELYTHFQEEENLEAVGCENRSVKQRLQNAFPKVLSFMSPPGKDEFIFCEASKQHLQPDRISDKVKEVGEAIRKEIQETKPMFTSWPPDPTDIKYEKAKIPDLLDLLLKTILQKKGRNKRTERLISSLGKNEGHLLYT